MTNHSFPDEPAAEAGCVIEYVTVTIGEQLFGLPIARVRDVFVPGRLTPVPLASGEIAGLINLRGRIVTAMDLRRRLNLPERKANDAAMAVGIDCDGESYGLVVDAVGEVVKLPVDKIEKVPVNLDRALARVATGVYRLEDQLLLVLDVDLLLDVRTIEMAA